MGPLTIVEDSLLVKDAIRNGQWDIPYFSFEIPTHLLLTFKAILIRKASTSTDKFSWVEMLKVILILIMPTS